jgi:hypothetical protein
MITKWMNDVNEARRYFSAQFPYVGIQAISDTDLLERISQPYLSDLSFEDRMEFVCDYFLANGLVEISL